MTGFATQRIYIDMKDWLNIVTKPEMLEVVGPDGQAYVLMRKEIFTKFVSREVDLPQRYI